MTWLTQRFPLRSYIEKDDNSRSTQLAEVIGYRVYRDGTPQIEVRFIEGEERMVNPLVSILTTYPKPSI
jgi:hypothetical protein